MDPLSIAASIAGLLTITGTIISKGYAHISEVKKQDGDFAALLNEVASFSGILHGLQLQYGTSTESEPKELKWVAQGEGETWRGTLEACEKTLGEIRELAKKRKTTSSVKLLVKGVSMTTRVDKLLLQVERF
jgi:hypothetical protein